MVSVTALGLGTYYPWIRGHYCTDERRIRPKIHFGTPKKRCYKQIYTFVYQRKEGVTHYTHWYENETIVYQNIHYFIPTKRSDRIYTSLYYQNDGPTKYVGRSIIYLGKQERRQWAEWNKSVHVGTCLEVSHMQPKLSAILTVRVTPYQVNLCVRFLRNCSIWSKDQL